MIPIFRAKKLDSDECVIGFIVKSECDEDFLIRVDGEYHFIDVSTLSIHFPDMIDSQGNKIFASLQEDGKGGDIMQDDEYFGIAKYKDCQFVVEYEDCIDNIDNGNFEVIGIQQ